MSNLGCLFFSKNPTVAWKIVFSPFKSLKVKKEYRNKNKKTIPLTLENGGHIKIIFQLHC